MFKKKTEKKEAKLSIELISGFEYYILVYSLYFHFFYYMLILTIRKLNDFLAKEYSEYLNICLELHKHLYRRIYISFYKYIYVYIIFSYLNSSS